jgi:hypothetical protein
MKHLSKDTEFILSLNLNDRGKVRKLSFAYTYMAGDYAYDVYALAKLSLDLLADNVQSKYPHAVVTKRRYSQI